MGIRFVYGVGIPRDEVLRTVEKLMVDSLGQRLYTRLMDRAKDGDKDGLLRISQGVHRYLKEKDVPHVWHVEPGGHDFRVWRNDLYWFAQRVFKE